jgi:hypothetical protein
MEIRLIDIYNALPIKDRDVFLSNFFARATNPDAKGNLFRFTATFSKDATHDELRRAFEKMMFLPEGSLQDLVIPDELDKSEANFRKVLQVIEPQKNIYLQNPKIKEDKYEELEQVGKLIVALNEGIDLELQVETLEYPDFIILKEGKRIGLEHTRLINGGSNAVFKNIQLILEDAKQSLLLQIPEATGVINVSINHTNIVTNNKSMVDGSFTLEERKAITEELSKYFALLITDPDTQKPSYVIYGFWQANREFSIDIKHAEMYLPEKPDEVKIILGERIQKKEANHSRYANSQPFDEVWLLVAMQGVKSSSGFKINGDYIPAEIPSAFNRIIVFDSFGYDLVEIKPTSITLK